MTWSFGDGQQAFDSSGAAPGNVTHTYRAAGTYSATLTAVDPIGNLVTATHQVTVGEAPAAVFAVTTPAPVPGAPVSFDASGSSDPDTGATIGSYAWKFGDGSTGTGVTPRHTYKRPGVYSVTLTVTDTLGQSASVAHQVAVDERPVAGFTFKPSRPPAGQRVRFNATSSRDRDGSIASYAWKFGDGQTATGARPSHAFKKKGTYTVTLTVVDSSGLTAVATHKIKVG